MRAGYDRALAVRRACPAADNNQRVYILPAVPCGERLARGNTMVNSLNCPGSVATSMLPPCCLTMMSWVIERPSPVPSPADGTSDCLSGYDFFDQFVEGNVKMIVLQQDLFAVEHDDAVKAGPYPERSGSGGASRSKRCNE